MLSRVLEGPIETRLLPQYRWQGLLLSTRWSSLRILEAVESRLTALLNHNLPITSIKIFKLYLIVIMQCCCVCFNPTETTNNFRKLIGQSLQIAMSNGPINVVLPFLAKIYLFFSTEHNPGTQIRDRFGQRLCYTWQSGHI